MNRQLLALLAALLATSSVSADEWRRAATLPLPGSTSTSSVSTGALPGSTAAAPRTRTKQPPLLPGASHRPPRRMDMMAYTAAQAAPPAGTEGEPPADPSAAEPQPSADPFADLTPPSELPPAASETEADAFAPPSEEPPAMEEPVLEPTPPTDTFPPRERVEPSPQPRRTQPAPRSAPPPSTPRTAPPSMPRNLPARPPAPRSPTRAAPENAAPQPVPETLPPPSRPTQPFGEPTPFDGSAGNFDGTFDSYDDFGGPFLSDDYGGCNDCGNCDRCRSGGYFWDNYCPPPTSCRIPCGTWVNVDYLMWWSRGQSLPPLVTTGSPSGTNAGSMADPNVRVLFGSDRVDDGIRSGGRLNLGTWFTPNQTFGIGGSFIGLQNMATNFAGASLGTPLLARPFFDTSTHKDNSEVIGEDGKVAGTIRGRTTNSFIASDIFFRQALMFAPRRRFDLIYGWRYIQVSDSLSIDDRTVSTDPNNPQIPLGTTIVGRDEFRTRNQFNGVELGLMTERRRSIWSLNTSGRISFGNMHQTVLINGDSTTTVPGAGSFHTAGSLLAQPSNIGRYDRNVFAVVPEATIALGCQITPRLQGTFGYSVIYINRVAQSGNQVDFAVDPTQTASSTGVAPTFHFQQSGYWVQGVNFGLNYKF